MATASSYTISWPTFTYPYTDDGLASPTPTYNPYMDPNGVIYSASYYQSGNYVGTGSASSQTVAVGDAYSVVVSSAQYSSSPPSGFSDWDSYGQYTAGLANDNATMTDGGDDGQDSSASPTTSSSSGSGGGHASPIKIVTAAVPGVIGLALIILGIWFCCRCKKRRRAKRTRTKTEQDGRDGGGAAGRYGQMEELERGVPVSATSRYQAPSLTRDEVLNVISPRTQQQRFQNQQQHRIDLVYPSRPQAAASANDPHHQQHNRLASPAGTFGGHQFPRRGPASHVGSSRHSRWTDDSEFDVMAEDGSTITRTISTTSTRRTMGGGDGDSIIMTNDENPFDHPAYTYRAAPQQQAHRSGTLSRNNTLTRVTPVGTWSSSQQPSLAYNSTLSPISPVTPMSTSFPSSPAPSYIQPQHQHREPRRNESDTYSIHSSEDGIFGNSNSNSNSASVSASAPMDRLSAPTRPGIRRDPTIIRHADSSAQGLGRYSTKIERAGRDDAGVVELPPLYEDATSSWTR